MSKSSLWSMVSRLPPESINNLYHEFPKVLRQFLADWLEEHPWDYLNGSDAFQLRMARNLLTRMLDQLRTASEHCRNKAELHQQVSWLEDICKREPQKMVAIFRALLQCERAAVMVQFHNLPRSYLLKQEAVKFELEVQRLLHHLDEAQALQVGLNQAEALNSLTPDTASIKMNWTSLILNAVTLLESMQTQMLMRITFCKREQQKAGNGTHFNDDLTAIQNRCETLFDLHYRLNRELMMGCDAGIESLAGVPAQLQNSRTILVKRSFLVEKQPPQVLKTATKFQASVRFLLGQKLLDGQEKMPTVKAAIITEKQAREMILSQNSEAWTECAGEILNNTSTMEKDPSTKAYGAAFKSLSVKKIKRCERKGSESVTEEKCTILFTVKITSSTISTKIHLEAMSLPLVVIVHGNQDNNAKATILWDNAFAEPERLPFVVAERVPWPKMFETLNMRFVTEVGTSQRLVPDHFIFLAQKVFNDNSMNAQDFQERSVSWSQFNKELLPGRGFTFWQWFDGVVELSKKCLKNFWSDKLIIGFISKQYVHQLLCTEPDGTFLLRFSDSEIGGITIAHILRNQSGSVQIQNIQPFSAHDLGIRTLGDRIRDLTQLKYLYPKKPKDETFQKHYTKEQGMLKTDGYTPATIKMEVSSNSQVYPPTMPCFQPSGILMSPPMPQGHMPLSFPHYNETETPMPVAPLASPPHLSGTHNLGIRRSPPPAYSPGGAMSPNTMSSFHPQYQEQMQVDPPQFQQPIMLSEMCDGSTNLTSLLPIETYPTLDDVFTDFDWSGELSAAKSPCHHL